MDLTRSNLLEAYRVMRLIRAFEERLHVEFATGEIPGFVHLYAGEEAIATGICLLLDERDKITSTHRGHGHCLAKGCDVYGMMAEIYGKKNGLCAGKGGSMHIADLSKGMLGANGIVGGGPPLACGAALAAKRLGKGGVAISFVGDGGANQGTFLESLNLASIWSLPCVFVVENNGYAEATSSQICGRMPRFCRSGQWLWDARRDGGRARLLRCLRNSKARRSSGRAGVADRRWSNARSIAITATTKATRNPIGLRTRWRKSANPGTAFDHFAQKVTSAGLLTQSELDEIDREVAALVEDSVKQAKSAPKPGLADLLTDVYISY